MKKFYTAIFALFASIQMMAQGWPANYNGVMLQGFFWDSYAETKWSNLESQADTLAKYYRLIWVPQSGYCNALTNQMGYANIWWFNQKSCFGSAAELKSMIKTFKAKNLLTIADVVINHKNGNTNWCDFPTETWEGHGTMTWSLADICKNDDKGKTRNAGYQVTGADDTGDDFDGCRDLDHTSSNVQKNIKLYLHFLQEEMGYAGYRYDMTGGYAPKYTKLYNEDAQPQFSVGEYWKDNGLSGLKNWIDGTGKTSAAFDFQLKWLIRDAFNEGGTKWNTLANYTTRSLIGNKDYRRYAVTFVDNHDTYRNSGDKLNANEEAANAYILTMPGTPCIFLMHWMQYKTAIKKLILAREITGVNNESEVLTSKGESNGYTVSVKGTKGNMLLQLGNTTTSTEGYQLAVSGENYKLYVSNGLDISEIKSVKDETNTTKLPDFVTPQEGTYAYFEKPQNWGSTIHVWAWNSKNGNENVYNGAQWPGTISDRDISKVGTNNGCDVYLWKYSGTRTPDMIIFNDGTNQTSNLKFTNGGYYNYAQGLVATGISNMKVPTKQEVNQNAPRYNLGGQRVDKDYKGIYVQNGKKYIAR